MNAFSEKSDLILRNLTINHLSWDKFTHLTLIPRQDAILTFLKNTEFIDYSNQEAWLTAKGNEFITTTSFVQQREDRIRLADTNASALLFLAGDLVAVV